MRRTAYELGLGIPAEPLFRSRKSGSAGMPRVARLMIHTPTAISIFVCLSMVQLRSEERFSRNAETDLVCRLLLEKKNFHASSSRRHKRPRRASCGLVATSPPRLV